MAGDEGNCEVRLATFSLEKFFWYVGFLAVLVIAFKVIRSLWRAILSCYLGDLLGFGVNWKKLGRWAVVTGATDGIGKAYANALAAKGFNIVLISRTQEKLKNVSKEIESKYQVETKTVAIDITGDLSIYETIKDAIKELDIGILVNNVGMSYKYAEYLTKIVDGEKFADDLIKANIVSCTRMTQIVLPKMEKRRSGVILNISSLSALSPVPLLSMYSASKAYVNFFTQATHEEYRTRGIILQSVLPGFVSTSMSKMRPSLTVCTPDSFVYWALKSVGIEERTYGHPAHKLQGYAQECLMEYMPESVNFAVTHRMMSDIRRRYYRKFGLTDNDS